jgi:hypothetical protein
MSRLLRCAHGAALWCSDCLAFVPARATLVVGFLVGLSCCVPIVPTPGPGGEGCAAGCANLDRLGCAWRTAAGPDDRTGTADDVPCSTWCTAYEREGVDLHTGCFSAAATCEAADACASGAP